MSPYFEPVVLEGRGYEIRLVGPEADVWPGSTPGVAAPPVALTTYAVLNQPAMSARRLPMTNSPNSPDMVSGEWTGRINDAGDFQLVFPNKEASDGLPWRNRFDPSLKRQWIEIYNDGYLEHCGCIEIVDKQRDQITISGHDGLWQTKMAYERDWIVTQAPRDVIDRGTQVSIPVLTDNFSPGSLDPQWTVTATHSSTVTVGSSGGLLMDVSNILGTAEIDSPTISLNSDTSTWRAIVTIAQVSLGTLSLFITEGNGMVFQFLLGAGLAILAFLPFGSGATTVAVTAVPKSVAYSLMLESDGEWINAFCNGQFVGGCRRRSDFSSTNSLQANVTLDKIDTVHATATISGIFVEALQPFLMAGTDGGDYVLPGFDDTYPSGGLHARYFNNLDIQGDANRLLKIHHPSRTQAYSGSGGFEYANQQDATINAQQNPLPGAATSNWSCIWFGAIWLNLSAGNYIFEIDYPAVANNQAIRVFIGKTQPGSYRLNNWGTFFSNISGGTFSFNTTQLTAHLSYDGGTVVRDGWYPIKIEYAVDGTAAAAPVFKITNSPATYTDPGGTVIAAGFQSTVVPATSLSPLGCVDQRYQGISHFDIITKTSQAFGYQISCEPKQIESGLFPGVCAPRIREGSDSDAILKPDDTQRSDTEGLLNYGNKLDGTDTCTSLAGNGAGFQNGTQGQLQGFIYDPNSLAAALFNIQGWQDFSDASFESLLQSLLNSELGLRLAPWQLVTGDPIGHPRLANMWPLSSALAQMRWRPGDGVRIYARDIGVIDLRPRQLLTVTRQIHPNGITGTQVGFSARPKTHEQQLAKAIYQVRRLGRNYQRQLVTLQSDLSPYISAGTIAPSGFTAFFGVALLPGDQIVQAQVRFAYNGGTVGLEINGTDVTTNLNGPWSGLPITINITSLATTAPNDGRLYLRGINKGGSSIAIQPQLILDVLR